MATISPTTARARGKVAALTRSRSTDDPDLVGARRELATSSLTDHIERVLAAAPPLTNEQRRRLAGLFTGGASA